MKLKKVPFAFSFALSALLIAGTTGLASDGSDKSGASDAGMMSMKGNEDMSGIMEAMNSPEGQEMLEACGNFMASMDEEKEVE